jgi:hypothetical protein
MHFERDISGMVDDLGENQGESPELERLLTADKAIDGSWKSGSLIESERALAVAK